MKPMFRRIWGLMYRHLALYRRSWPRLLELCYWPILQMCIWGFTARFLAARMGNPGLMAGATLLGGVLLWEVTLRSQMGMSISFLEEMWSRNLGHVFVSPLRPFEMIAALIAMYRPEQLEGHLQRAVNNGVTLDEIKEVITHLAFYAGWPSAMSAAQLAYSVFVEGKKQD